MRPMLFVEDGKVIIQNARRLCTGYMGLPRSSDIPPISEAQAEAIDALHFLAEKHHLKLNFQKGDIQYINNLSMFHARDGFTETAEQKYVVVVVVSSTSRLNAVIIVLAGVTSFAFGFETKSSRGRSLQSSSNVGS